MKEKNGKYSQIEYVVTVTSDHYILVKATDRDQAKQRALKIAQRTGGTKPRVTGVAKA